MVLTPVRPTCVPCLLLPVVVALLKLASRPVRMTMRLPLSVPLLLKSLPAVNTVAPVCVSLCIAARRVRACGSVAVPSL